MEKTDTPSNTNTEIVITLENIDYLMQISIEKDNIILSAKPVDPNIPFY